MIQYIQLANTRRIINVKDEKKIKKHIEKETNCTYVSIVLYL